MGVRRDPIPTVLAALSSDRLRRILSHWDDVRGDRLMPGWEDIDPVAIARELPIIWAWKYLRETDSFQGRFAGEEINAIFGKSLRGADMREFFADWEYERVFQKRRRVVTEPCIAVGTGHVFVHADRYGVGERIILPLAGNGRDGDGVLGATTYDLSPEPVPGFERAPVEEVDFFPLRPADRPT